MKETRGIRRYRSKGNAAWRRGGALFREPTRRRPARRVIQLCVADDARPAAEKCDSTWRRAPLLLGATRSSASAVDVANPARSARRRRRRRLSIGARFFSPGAKTQARQKIPAEFKAYDLRGKEILSRCLIADN